MRVSFTTLSLLAWWIFRVIWLCAGQVEYQNQHLQGGVLRSSYRNVESCKRACSGNCRAVDFNFRFNTCWFHFDPTVCKPRKTKTGCSHFVFVSCDTSSHVLGGTFFSVSTDVTSCINACAEDSSCQAVDFNSVRNSCWFHTPSTSCARLTRKTSCNHYKLLTCDTGSPAPAPTVDDDIEEFKDRHALGGTLQSNIVTTQQCIQACRPPGCQAVDFNSLSRTCWFHTQTTACSELVTKESCTHYKVESCESSPVEPASCSSCDCGVSRVTSNEMARLRIVGGMEATPHSWPWMVALFYQGSQICGGSLVSSRYVVTAAHCFFETRDPRDWIVRLGDHDQNVLEDPEIEVEVVQIAIHSQYDATSQDYDIAVIRLEEEVSIGNEILPVCVPESGTRFQEGMECITTGWGDTMGTGSSGVLNQVMVPLLNQDLCNSPEWYNGVITSRMVCAGYEEGRMDSCQGDSGGPLACRLGDNWLLAGITSFGDGCAQPRRPGVYTRVSQFVDWLNLNAEL